MSTTLYKLSKYLSLNRNQNKNVYLDKINYYEKKIMAGGTISQKLLSGLKGSYIGTSLEDVRQQAEKILQPLQFAVFNVGMNTHLIFRKK